MIEVQPNTTEEKVEQLVDTVAELRREYADLLNKNRELEDKISRNRFTNLTKEERKDFQTALDDDMFDVFWNGNNYVHDTFASTSGLYVSGTPNNPIVSEKGLKMVLDAGIGANMLAYRYFTYGIDEKWKEFLFRATVEAEYTAPSNNNPWDDVSFSIGTLYQVTIDIVDKTVFGVITSNGGTISRIKLKDIQNERTLKLEIRVGNSATSFYVDNVLAGSSEVVPDTLNTDGNAIMFVTEATNGEAIEKSIYIYGYEFMQKI